MTTITKISPFALLLPFLMACNSPIQQGMPTPAAHSTELSYYNSIQPLVANHCTTCHGGKGPAADLNLKGYDNLVDAIQHRQLLQRINDPTDPMPPSGLLSKQERTTIKQWSSNNFPIGVKPTVPQPDPHAAFEAPDLQAVNIEEEGFEFFEKIQGHWVGKIFLLGQNIPWFAFDFRAIHTAQVHGLFEGGSMGNLFNTFFVAEYRGVKTIMLRNGGILGGTYRSSYFVLTKATANDYLFEDAYGGKQIMWVRVSFYNNTMKLLAYTSRMGSKRPMRHIEFDGQKLHTDLAEQAAQQFDFPTPTVVKKFPNGLPLPDWGDRYPTVTSASYLAEDDEAGYVALGKRANDPIKIYEVPNLATIQLKFGRTDLSQGKNIQVYLSRVPLTHPDGRFKTTHGYITEAAMNEVLLFPEIDQKEQEFLLTYLHTGKCYLTCVVDNDQDFTPSKGDFYSQSLELNLSSGPPAVLKIDDISNTIP